MIFTNTVTVAGGPRLLTGSMGPIVNDFNSGNTDYNNTFTTDNTRQLNGFVLTFDRPVDPATLTPGMITVTYRDPNTPAGSPGTDISNQITGITPLDLSAAHGPNASGTPPSFSVSDTIVQEPFASRTSASFTVILSQAVGTPVSVDWSTQDDTGSTAATSTGVNADYVPSHGTLVFNPGQVTASFQVPVLKDSLFTSNRHFLVNLSNAPAAIVINRTQGKATIISDQNVPAHDRRQRLCSEKLERLVHLQWPEQHVDHLDAGHHRRPDFGHAQQHRGPQWQRGGQRQYRRSIHAHVHQRDHRLAAWLRQCRRDYGHVGDDGHA